LIVILAESFVSSVSVFVARRSSRERPAGGAFGVASRTWRGKHLASTVVVTLSLARMALCGAADDLPLVRVPAAAGTTGPMILLLTGDGDWAPFPKELAALATAAGAPVLGLKMRSYLGKPRKPEELAAALAPVVRAQLRAWNRTELMLVGYSRGADAAPFVVNRWPEDLRAQLSRIVFVGLSEHASFEFHLTDLMLDTQENSFCDHPVSGMQVTIHPGSHRAGGDVATAEVVLQDLGLGR
jgi:type IV secretory pathway VirJ component